MKLKDLYKPTKPLSQGATPHGWHSIVAALRCMMEYKLATVAKLRIPILGTPDPLAKGSLFHVGRAVLFESKFDTTAKAMNKVYEAMRKAHAEANPPYSNEALVHAMSYVTQYAEHWSVRPKPTPVGVEYTLGPIGLTERAPWWLQRTARLDDVSYYPEVMRGGKPTLCIGEAKTTSVGADDTENEYLLNGQLLMQFMLWRMAPNGEKKHGPVSHIMLDVVKKGYGGEKCTFARVPVQVTHTSLAWFVPMMEATLTATARINIDTPVMRNITACTRQVGRMRLPCPYRDLCRFGDPAASKYVTADGTSAAKAFADMKVKPWA